MTSLPSSGSTVSVFLAMLAALLLIDAAAGAHTAAESALRSAKLQAEADSLASMLSRILSGSEWDAASLSACTETARREGTSVTVGIRGFGEAAPGGRDVFVSRRLVTIGGELELLEVRKW